MSRARDRLYVFHSVTEDMLKPDDLKAEVLAHMRHPMEQGEREKAGLEAVTESPFEAEVLSRLLLMGYRVRPQVEVGSYRIDLVVEGRDDRRLAIELDGDRYHGPEKWAEDTARQRVLERVGWRFWRCWGSSFALDPEGCMADLVRALESMGIEPIGGEAPPNVWTEFRTIGEAPVETSWSTAQKAQDVPTVAAMEHPPALQRILQPGRSLDAVEPEIPLTIAVGDRIQIQILGESRVRTVVLTADKHDPDLGFISVKHPSGRALLGATEDEEIEFELNGQEKRWMVLRVEKVVTLQ